MKRGKFIVFEGINGCGKGTQLIRFADHIFDDRSNTVFLTREPNNFDDDGLRAREILKSDGSPYNNNVQALKYFSRNGATHQGIFLPMLEKGINVLSDRLYHSRFAFQHAQKISYEEIAKENRYARAPDLTFIFDVPVDVAFERLEKRDGTNRRKFDSDFKFMEKVRGNYLELPDVLPELMSDNSITIIDGNQGIEKVFDDVLMVFGKRF